MINDVLRLIGILAVSLIALALLAAGFEAIREWIIDLGSRGYFRAHRNALEEYRAGRADMLRRGNDRVRNLIGYIRRLKKSEKWHRYEYNRILAKYTLLVEEIRPYYIEKSKVDADRMDWV